MSEALPSHWDFVIVGSGFGGATSALRLAEKGYRVLVLEKGRRWNATDFPETNWDVRNFLWAPRAGLRGPLQMRFFRHVTVLAGVGVGGGSLVYGNTLPVPNADFFTSGDWAGLADWAAELGPHYATAKRMLGVAQNPRMTRSDHVLKELAAETGRAEHWRPTDVGVFFGEPGKTVPDPYFGGEGPERTGCTFCGGCFTGCRHGAKNTLDRNYLWLAERKGARVLAETEVEVLQPARGGGYRLTTRSTGKEKLSRTLTADQVVLSGGVLGTVDLLLAMKGERDGLPELSDRVGASVRTNSESLIGVTTRHADDLAEGIAITSILHTDAHSHVEPCRFGPGSGMYRLLALPHAPSASLGGRLAKAGLAGLRAPLRHLGAVTVRDWASHTAILLYMRTVDGSLRFVRGRNPGDAFRLGLATELAEGQAPAAAIPEATELARRFAEKVGGVAQSLFTETVLDIPSTAHVLGGACIGGSRDTGVIDTAQRVFGYPGLYVADGSAVSANPGVNPSLTITAMTERAMSRIPAR